MAIKPHWAYRFATVDIIERGNAITLFMLPYKELDTDAKIVRKLLEEANKRIKIKCLYGDQEFSYAHLIDTYNELGIEYLIRAKGDYIYKKEKKTDKPIWFEFDVLIRNINSLDSINIIWQYMAQEL